ncbi:MAG: carbamoyl-phosphate synthase large subunit [Candidatus Sumerlaeota bacterium]|nr:carbamoyl-phosphate synthase large subunit [Candidatus Sumerlaeota bacterium]
MTISHGAQHGPQLTQTLRRLKSLGFSDMQIAYQLSLRRPKGAPAPKEEDIRHLRERLGVTPVYKAVDTCAGEFEAYTPYFYSTYEETNESLPSNRKKIIILGGGPNRIGQGIEFDYCCVHAVFALREDGYETIMINSNPETVSTDYDTADRLYFEPLTAEDVLHVIHNEKPDGVIVQFGGQTPLKLTRQLEAEGVPIIGTSPDSIDLAEDRKRFAEFLKELGIPAPPHGSGNTLEEVRAIAAQLGYPVIVRPSYVLGGRAMQIVYSDESLHAFMEEAREVSPDHPVFIDKFLDNATEVDVDAVADGQRCVIAAIMEHIEQAGIHSGDSACMIPPRNLSEKVLKQIREYTWALGKALQVRGLMNIQYAVKNEEVQILEVNPRASRTVPFVSKTIGVPLAKIAARIMVGKTLEEQGFTEERTPNYYSVKEAVLPFAKFYGCDVELGPEMRSTGEVMGVDSDYAMAFAKSQIAAGGKLPIKGGVFISINRNDKELFLPIVKQMHEMGGFRFIATSGTRDFFLKHGIESTLCRKVKEGRPSAIDFIINNEVDIVISTFTGADSKIGEKPIRTYAIARGIPLFTTAAAAGAVVEAIAALRKGELTVHALQDLHASLK